MFMNSQGGYKIADHPKFDTDDRQRPNSPQAAPNNKSAAMDINVWCILASVLLASSQAIRYDLNPQKFYQNSPSPALRSQRTKEVVLYLTPSQVKALEAGGAVVRSQAAESEATTEAQQQEPAAEEPQQNAEPEQQPENENEEEEIRPVSNLEEIFRILNDQIEEQQQNSENANEEQAEEEQQNEEEESNEEDETENESNEESNSESESESESEEDEESEGENENESESEEDEEEEEAKEEKKAVTEKPRDIPTRFRFVAKSQKAKKQNKYVAPIVAKKEKEQAKNYAYIRFVPNDQTQEITLQLVNNNEQEAPSQPEQRQEEQANPSTESPVPQPAIQSIPYEVTENPEEAPAPESELEVEEIEARLAALLTPLINHEKIAESINEQKKKLLQNELEIQNLLRELTQAPKQNDQNYAIQIERLRSNLDKQNALAKAEALAKSATSAAPVIKEEATKKNSRLVQSRKSKTKSAPATALARLTQLAEAKKSKAESVKVVPAQKAEKQKAEKSAKLQIQKRVPSTVTKYVKVPKQYPVQRVIPVEIKREIPQRKSEKSVLRPVWEH